jgi:hypothetical protein
MTCKRSQLRLESLAWVGILLVLTAAALLADAPAVSVQLDVSKATPRAVESETERRILSDYRLAWASIAQAVESNTSAPVQFLFVGPARKWLEATVANQRRSGLTTRYLNQSHTLQAVFYSPEGDVIELHDTAQYQMQVLDGGKVIHDDRVVQRYVVLMTPGADRWVIRQLVAVPRF